MNKKNSLSTENKILTAANEVFIEKGRDGARMQEIADKAGINKALLHYYFRSKDKLFEAVFNWAFSKLMPQISSILNEENELFEKIERFVEAYISVLAKNSYIPNFVLHELSRNPSHIVNIIKHINIRDSRVYQQITEEREKGNIINIEPEQLIVNIMSLCVFPFGAKPIIKSLLLDNNDEKYKQFIEQRKKSLSEFIINGIKN